ncbi:FixH family protein [Alkalibacillus salilacus]|uniref:YtkA-like domain-containing protein n=1 Tax=Alkalibacillus salilacus TaxID=284582 RepID=A0ABT9VD08_9BACI|nr:FixH family protein [Alkalibacillus salilacus]MDQ0158861.1 hypothetical protein [Alkalibacillus salilacus]
MKRYIWILLITLVILTACGQGNDSEDESNGSNTPSDQVSIEPVEIEIITPSQIDAGEQTLSAKVTHNEEVVTNAQKVEFEVWKTASKEESEMLTAEHHENGKYQIDYSFEESGSYHIQYHVTAKDQHVMPKHEVTVGSEDEVAEETVNEDNENKESDESHNHSDKEGHHHHASTVETTLNTQWSEQTLDISSKLDQVNQPFSDATVTFEITSAENESLHEWVNAEESEEGLYTGTFNGLSVSDITIVTHIKKDELHEHQEETVQKQ